jgi:glutaconate CoA-transferase subunit A
VTEQVVIGAVSWDGPPVFEAAGRTDWRVHVDGSSAMADVLSLGEAVAALVRDGDTVALEGFTHLIPFAAGHEIIRQGRRDLTLVRMTPDLVYDQLIGMGCARRLVFSWGGNPGVGSLHRFRDAVQNGWPRPLAIEEHSHAGMANRYVAGASGLPFAVLRGYAGTDLAAHTDTIKPITCPFTGEVLTAVPALRPDVTVVHAQRADRAGNVQMWGITGIQKEAVLAATRSLVTVEEIVEELTPVPDQVVLPTWVVTAVAEVPGGSHPSYSMGYSTRDNEFYRKWDGISRDRETFQDWMREHVLGDWAAGGSVSPGQPGRSGPRRTTGGDR